MDTTRNFLALAALILVLIFSGCTGFPFIGGGGGESIKATDIIVIKSLDVYPSDTIKSNQEFRVVAYVENLADEKKSVNVDMFDYCADKFEIIVACPEANEQKDTSNCDSVELLPKEAKQISWKLPPKPSIGRLGVACDLKTSVEYKHKTTGQTSIDFINANEMQSQIERGEFVTVSSQINKGDGPVKVFFEVEDRQPIPTDDAGTTPITLKVVNEGQGFVKGNAVNLIKTNVFNGDFYGVEDCLFSTIENEINLTKGSRDLTCKLTLPKTDDDPKISKQKTKFMNAEIEYDYEFRKNIKVTVKPQ